MKAKSTKPNTAWFKQEIGFEEFFYADSAIVPNLQGINTTSRIDERNYSQSDRNSFIAAIRSLVASGAYSNFVNIHVNMAHDMHSRMFMDDGSSPVTPTGTQRFLSWHRAYLLEFEKLLQTQAQGLRIPYWRWSIPGSSFPSWLQDYLPTGLTNADAETYNVSRRFSIDNHLPTREDISSRLNLAPYTVFSLALEGRQPYGAHNQVHVYVGGTMSSMYSPADPVFWMHHAEIDRLWHIWQLVHLNQNPTLSGNKRIMDPWYYRIEDLLDITRLGYTYDDLSV